MTLTGIACAGYYRVSTEQQAGEAQTSPVDQQRGITGLATALGVTVGAWYHDLGASGATVERRPGLRQLIADCEATPRPASRPGYILVLNDSRWGRFPDPEESAYWRTHLRRFGWLVRFVENDDSQNLTVRSVMRAIVASQATQKREDVRANAKRGSRGTAALGYWGTREPYGYRRKVVYPPGRDRVLAKGQRKAPDEKVSLTPEPTEAGIVRELYRRYASGEHTLATLTAWLRAEAPDRRWTRAAVRFTLSNPAYMGDVVSGRVTGDKTERAATPERSEADWVISRDAHPALVARALFADVQDVLARNGKWTTRVRADWLVSGLVRCPCGQPYVAGGGNTNRHGIRTRSYRCITKAGLPGDRCAFPGSIKKEWLERCIVDTIAAVVSRPSFRRRLLVQLDAALAAVRSQPADSAAALDKQMAEATASRDRLVQAVADGTLTHAEARTRLDAVRRVLGRLVAQREALSLDRMSQRALDAERDRVAALALDFRRAATVLHGPALREFVRPWIASATFDPRDRLLHLAIYGQPALAHGDLTRMPWPTAQRNSYTGNLTHRSVKVGAPRSAHRQRAGGSS